jgi:hypothetical protein
MPLSPRLLAVVDALPLRPGLRVLEIGGAPGAAAREVASRVGPSGHVLVLDRSRAGIRLTELNCAALLDALTSSPSTSRLPVGSGHWMAVTHASTTRRLRMSPALSNRAALSTSTPGIRWCESICRPRAHPLTHRAFLVHGVSGWGGCDYGVGAPTVTSSFFCVRVLRRLAMVATATVAAMNSNENQIGISGAHATFSPPLTNGSSLT